MEKYVHESGEWDFWAHSKIFGLQPIDFFGQIPLASIIFIVSWIWLPFATLILLTALQSLDQKQMEAAEIDGASKWNKFLYNTPTSC